MATSQAVASEQIRQRAPSRAAARSRLDFGLIVGIVIAFGAVVAGMASTGIGLNYFLQPTGLVIVLGGTLGIMLVTTPRHALLDSLSRVVRLLSAPSENREALVEEIVTYARAVRRDGVPAIEAAAQTATNPFLREALLLVPDVNRREELQSAVETDLRMRERQGEADAHALEVAGGYAPTMGIIGTVVGLIDVLRHFSDLQQIGPGVGTAFVSTIYGLGLANLVLLPLAHRIRSRVAEAFEIQELIVEGVLSIVDKVHPSLIRLRLFSYLRDPQRRLDSDAPARREAAPQP